MSGAATTAETGRSEPRWAFLAWVGFTLLLFYAVVIGGGWLGMYLGPVRVLDLVISALALLAWLIVASRRTEWRPTSAIWPAFVASLGAIALSAAGSAYPRLGLEILSVAVLLTTLYLLLVRIVALPYVQVRIGGLMAALALVMGLAYIGWSVVLWLEWWSLVGELRMPPLRPAHLGMTWGSPSVVLTVQVLMTAAALGGLGVATRAARLTATILVTVLAAVAIISGSRSGWLSLGGALVIVGGLALLDARGRDLLARTMRSRAGRWALVPVAAVVLVVAVVFGPTMIDRFAGYGDGGRPTYWATALRMFEDAPLLGQGPGTWMVRRVAFTEAGELDLYQPHAHDQYLQTAAELGLAGLAAGAVALGAVAWLLWRALRDRGAQRDRGTQDDRRGQSSEAATTAAVRRRWAWASLFGLVYVGLNVIVDVHTIVTVPLLLGIPIAVLDATSTRGIGLPAVLMALARPLRAASIAGLAIGCVAALVFLGRVESAALTHARAVTAGEAGDWPDALTPALDAAAADPEVGAFQLTAALASAAEGDWPAAEAAYRAVTELDGLPTAWLGLAAAQAELGAGADAVAASLEEALRLGSQQAALTLAAAQLYDRVGLAARADETYATTLALMPSLAADPAWRAALGPQRLASVVDMAIAASPSTPWEIALMAGDADRARDLAEGIAAPELVLAFIDAWEGEPAAVSEIQAAADADPEDPTLLAFAARVSDRAGDEEATARYRRLLRLGPHYGPSPVNVGLGQRDPELDAATGTSTYFYGTYTYRRPTELDPLVPGLAGLVVRRPAPSPAP